MSEPVVETSTRPLPMLRREAILPRERRGGLGAVALLCSLAGVASGFALATTILATQIAASEAQMARRSYIMDLGAMHPGTMLGVVYHEAFDRTAEVPHVKAASPAEAIGLKPGDHIVRFNGELIDQTGELGALIQACPVGAQPTLEVHRGPKVLQLTPTLGYGDVTIPGR